MGPVRARITGATAKKVSDVHVLKKFGGKWHRGKAVSTDVDMDTNEQIWSVMYDDGDREDFSAREMAGSLVGAESEDEDAGTGQLGDSSDNSSSDNSDHSDSEYDLVT
jgi:hypothetical protein